MKGKQWKAVAVCFLIGGIATLLVEGQRLWFGRIVVGAPMLALVIGMVLYNLPLSFSAEFKAGAGWVGKHFLNVGIVLTGATLSFGDLLGTGVKALPLILINLCLAFGVALLLGRRLHVSRNISIMVGGGTSICGGTAIATLARIIKAHEEEIAFAMAAIFLFDTLAAFTYPYFAQVLGLSANQFAFWAGAAINDTSSVAGAQATYAGMQGLLDYNGALNVKLVRTSMLLFVVLFWVIVQAKGQEKLSRTSLLGVVVKSFPLFILGFVLMAGLNTLGLFEFVIIGQSAAKWLGSLSKFLFAAALAGVGFKLKFSEVFAKGKLPILLGGVTWVSVCLVSLGFVYVFAGYVG